jgi:phospholipase C
MDGFYTTDGIDCMGYYTGTELPYYYSLFPDSTLCANYFCSQLGPTWPNRFYLAAGTSGGITTNGVWGYGVFDYPIILDLLEARGITWKVYNIGWDSVPFGNTDNVFVFWKRWAHDQRTRGSKGGMLNDLRKGQLPQVSFVVPSFARGWDEHPPADVSVGMGIQQELITALQDSPAWDTSAYILTYDEHGGYFDHVAPPTFDAYGAGVRVPTWVPSRADGVRAHLDAQVPRAGVRPAHAGLYQQPIRRIHAGGPEQRRCERWRHRTARSSSRRPARHRRSHGMLRVLTASYLRFRG